jgi:hypothetical protein
MLNSVNLYGCINIVINVNRCHKLKKYSENYFVHQVNIMKWNYISSLFGVKYHYKNFTGNISISSSLLVMDFHLFNLIKMKIIN